MAKRSIDSEIRKSYSFSKLTFRQRDLWHGLIESVDDQGRMPADPKFVISQVWPFGGVTADEVSQDLETLQKSQMVILYDKGGGSYLQIINWWKYQKSSWMGKSRFPAPDNWVDRCRYHGKGNKIIEINWDKEGGLVSQPMETKLACQQSREGEVNGEVNGEEEVKDEVKLTNPTNLFSSCQEIYETKVGQLVTDGQAFSQMIAEFEKEGVTAKDYAAAIDAMSADPKYARAKRPTSYQNWAIGYAEDRRNGTKKKGKRATDIEGALELARKLDKEFENED